MRTEAVRQMYDDGLRKWPHVELAFETFARHCEAVLGAECGDPSSEGADLFLCCACALGNAQALKAFERDALDVARASIARVRRDREFVQETLQEVWDKLLAGPSAKVAQYRGRGPLQAWVRVSATRVALDRCRALGVAVGRQVELTDRLPSPERSAEFLLLRNRYGQPFQEALQAAVAALPARDRNVLRMHVCGQCNIDEIGRAYDVHRATAARWLERARAMIAEGVRAALSCRNLNLTDSEFGSLARSMAGELELRLSGSSVHAAEGSPSAN